MVSKKLKEKINDCFSRMSYFGNNSHVPFGYNLGTRIHDFSIKGQVKDDEKNHISGIFDENEVCCTLVEGIANTIIDYFLRLFSATDSANMGPVIESRERFVTPTINNILLQEYKEDKVRRALFQMHPSKSSDFDGMSLFFFQKYWHIVGHNVTNAILSILRSRHLLRKMNYTHVVMIPKVNEPKHASDFHLISLGNVVSRIFSKVLVNRIKLILPNIKSNA